MSFQEAHARFCRLHQDSIAWKLLRAHNAPFILAFLRDLLSEENEVPYGRARAALQSELDDSRAQGWLEGETTAGQYLNQWIQPGLCPDPGWL